MGKRVKKILKSDKGNSILAFIVIISMTAMIGVSILPSLRQALGNRVEIIMDYYNGTDTITAVD